MPEPRLPLRVGGCFCGAIRYEADGAPFHEPNCHCLICRPTTGAPFLSMLSVRSIEFRITKGQPMRFNSTAKSVRSFCSRCGTQLTGKHADFPEEIGITTASLDNPNLVLPRVNSSGWIPSWAECRNNRRSDLAGAAIRISFLMAHVGHSSVCSPYRGDF